ncbi:MAG: GyrI-like domain-containing protein, partial [Bradyrhizobium sp.]
MKCSWRVIALAAVLAIGATAPLFAQTPAPPPPAPAPIETPGKPPNAAPGDPFGEEVTLTPKTIIYLKGNSTCDKALDSLVDA